MFASRLGIFNSPERKDKYHRCIAQLISPSPRIEDRQPDESPTINSLILGYYCYTQTYYAKNDKPTDEVHGIRATLTRILYGKTLAKDFGPRVFKLVREAMIQEGLSRQYINDSISAIGSPKFLVAAAKDERFEVKCKPHRLVDGT